MADSEKIVIVGAGTVGSHIAQLLQEDRYSVVIIDRNAVRLKELANSLDVQTLVGHGADPKVLEKAGAKEADLLLSLTDNDEVNLLSAFVGKKLGVKQCVARALSSWCLDTTVADLRNELGIDLIMNPEHLTALEIVRSLENPDALFLARFAHGKVQLRTMILQADSKFAGEAVKDCPLPRGVVLAVLSHEGEVTIPTGDTILPSGAKLTFLGVPGELDDAGKLFQKKAETVRSVVIAGGGVSGAFLAEVLERRGYQIKVIERDLGACERLSERLHRANVIHGDATDKGFLKEERINRSDVFIATMGDDEGNLMACLLAKEIGAPMTIVHIVRPDYATLVQRFGIDLALSPRHVIAETILKLIGRGTLRAINLLEDGRVEVAELVAEYGGAMVGKPLSKVSMPKDTLIAAIVHLGETIIPRGHHQIEPGDTVIAVGLRAQMDEIEERLRGR